MRRLFMAGFLAALLCELTGCGGTPASPSAAIPTPPPAAASGCAGAVVRDCTVRPYRVSGFATDDDGRPVAGAKVTAYPFIFGGGSSSQSATTDARGFYEIQFEAMQDAVGFLGYVSAQREGHERDGHFLKPSSEILQSLRLYRIKRIAAGDTLTLTVLPGDPPCGFEDEWVCRIVRLTPSASGTLHLSLARHSGSAVTGLEVTIPRPPGVPFRPICCSHEVSVAVEAGQEVIVSVLADWTTREAHSFTLRTSLAPE